METPAQILARAGIRCQPISPLKTMDGPLIERVVVSGSSAVRAWQVLRDAAAKTGRWPLVTGTPDDQEHLSDLLQINSEHPVMEILKYAEALDAREWLSKQRDLDEATFAEFGGLDLPEVLDAAVSGAQDEMLTARVEWPSRPSVLDSPFYTISDSRNNQPLPQVVLALPPTANPCETPAWMRFGDFNDCPEPAVHVAMIQYWQEWCQIEPVCLTGDVLEFAVSRPPVTPEASRALALEQYTYCHDIVVQGTQTVDALAVELWGSPKWFFWWD